MDGPEGQIGGAVERDKRAAYQTLRSCLVTVAQLMAPFAPFVSEELWQNLQRPVQPSAPESVHLSVWPQKADAALLEATEGICADMALVLRIVSLGRAARMDHNLKVRQPLSKVLVQVPNAAVRQAALRYEAVIRDELNVEKVQLVEGGEQLVSYTLRPNLPKLGKKYGKRVKPIQDALLAMAPADAARVAEAVLREQTITLTTADGAFDLEADEVLLSAQAAEGLAARTEEGVVVAITTEITPELVPTKEGEKPQSTEASIGWYSLVNEARSAFVVLDTAPTGHSLLLMDATGAYHRQMTQQYQGSAGGAMAKHIITPLMRLQDADMTHVVIVTLPEVTPVSQAAALQDDLRRAKIEPWAWVINKSLAASGTVDPLLRARIAAEQRQIERIAAGLAGRTCVLPWLPEPPVGLAALRRLATSPA